MVSVLVVDHNLELDGRGLLRRSAGSSSRGSESTVGQWMVAFMRGLGARNG